MKEVRRKVVPEKSPLKDCLGIVKMSVQHPEIKWLMIFPAVYSGFTIVLLWLFQPVMGLTLVPVALFGIFIGLNQGFRVLFSKFAYKIIKFFGPQRLLGVFIGALFFAFGLMAFLISADNLPMWLVYLLIAVMVIVPASQTMCGLIFNDYIHTRIESNERGTVLSVTSMFNTGIGALFLIAAKPLLDNLGIFWTVIIFLGFVAILFLPLKKVLKIKKL